MSHYLMRFSYTPETGPDSFRTRRTAEMQRGPILSKSEASYTASGMGSANMMATFSSRPRTTSQWRRSYLPSPVAEPFALLTRPC
jgi:hypothetical protein